MRHLVMRCGLRVVIWVLLTAVLYRALAMFFTYQTYLHERRIARSIESLGGQATFQDLTPGIGPRFVRERLQFFDRIGWIWLNNKTISEELISELGSLANLKLLALDDSQVSDAELLHFTMFSNLEALSLERTPTTPKGRAMLRKSLPNCQITPDP